MVKELSHGRALPLLAACAVFGALFGLHDAAFPDEAQSRESVLCLDCHADQGAALAETGHAVKAAADAPGARVACTDCHGSDSKHWEEDPDRNPMVLPGGLGPVAEARLCASCHQTAHQQDMLEKNVHTRHGVGCSGCHSVHAGQKHTALLKSPEPTLCYGCHSEVQGEFARSYRHPVADGVMQCSQCHRTLEETGRELSQQGGSSSCTDCHPEFQGPFPFEHQATLDFSTQEGGCLNCHAAHGSDNPKMLHQPYEPPHFQLCSQCHTVPGHRSNTFHGTRWAGLACNTCHTDIHGSYTNRLFVSESLEAQGCLKTGCHGH